jgi:hypothetical protein
LGWGCEDAYGGGSCLDSFDGEGEGGVSIFA